MALVVTYKHGGHDIIRKRQILNPLLPWQRVHYVQQRDESWRLHGRPPDLPRKIEARLGRGLAHGIVGEEPLVRRELGKTVRKWLGVQRG